MFFGGQENRISNISNHGRLADEILQRKIEVKAYLCIIKGHAFFALKLVFELSLAQNHNLHDILQRRIQNFFKHLRWSDLRN